MRALAISTSGRSPAFAKKLRQELEARAAKALGDNPPPGALTNLRQHNALLQALQIMRRVHADGATLPRDILATEIRAALLHLADISGQRALSEEILDRIFRQFCIGK